MSQDMNIMESVHSASKAFGKVHYIVFVTLLLSMVGVTLLNVTSTLNSPVDPKIVEQLAAERSKDDFENNTTIPRINKLEFSEIDFKADVTLPKNQRINPFIEEGP